LGVAAKTFQRPTAARSTRAAASRPTRARNVARDAEQSDPLDATQVDFGPLNQYLGYYLRRLYDGYRKHFVAAAGDLDVQPREVGALFVIGLNPGLTPSQLSAALAMDGAQITAMLNMFDARGLLERRVSSADARSRLVYLTLAGKRMLQRLRKLVGGFDRSFAGDALTDEELGQLIGLLAKLLAGVGD
jgi:DNA-binding MarR family transcriptional regulator